ncbi:PEP-CTERM sorting domain-containing protein [Aestuariispira insulae]|nr:PEP-CTERM sorting domain-containing protein [Aestuariispira insulae]
MFKKIMKRLAVAALPALAGFVPGWGSGAEATLVMGSFEGRLDQVDARLASDFAMGDHFSGHFIYDTDALPNRVGQITTYRQDIIRSFEFTINGRDFQNPVLNNSMRVLDDLNGSQDQLRIKSSFAGAETLAGFLLDFVSIGLLDFDHQALADDLPPQSLPAVEDFEGRDFQLHVVNPANDPFDRIHLSGELDRLNLEVVLVPEPPLVLLLGLGLIAIGWRRRRS